MAKTYEQIVNEITTKIVPKVTAANHRSVDKDILDYAKEIKDTNIKHVTLNHTTAWSGTINIPNTIPLNSTILMMQAFVVAKRTITGVASVGTIISIANGFDLKDSGRTPSQGLAIYFNPEHSDLQLKLGEQLTIGHDLGATDTDFTIRISILYI